MAGSLLALARALGEFGAVVIVSGNIINQTLTAPVLISQLITGFKPEAAAAIGTLLFGLSFVVVLIVERLGRTRGAEVMSARRDPGAADVGGHATAPGARRPDRRSRCSTSAC